MQSSDDSELMLRFQRDRDYGAFDRLFRRHKDALLLFLLRLAANRAIAEDVSQQTWLKLIDVARKGAYAQRAGVTFRTWLCTLARNHLIDEYQRKFAASRTVALPEDLHESGAHDHDPVPDPSEALEQRELARHLNRALFTLPFEQREVLALWAAGIELDDIVALTGVPRDTVFSRKKYAIAKLRAALSSLGHQECQA